MGLPLFAKRPVAFLFAEVGEHIVFSIPGSDIIANDFEK